MRYFMDNKTKFKELLKELRIKNEMTQEKLAEKANINVKYYGRIERGDSIPTILKFFDICNGLKIPYSQFMYKMEKYEKKK